VGHPASTQSVLLPWGWFRQQGWHAAAAVPAALLLPPLFKPLQLAPLCLHRCLLTGMSSDPLLLYNNGLALPLMAAFMLLATNEAAEVAHYPQARRGADRSSSGLVLLLHRANLPCSPRVGQIPAWTAPCLPNVLANSSTPLPKLRSLPMGLSPRFITPPPGCPVRSCGTRASCSSCCCHAARPSCSTCASSGALALAGLCVPCLLACLPCALEACATSKSACLPGWLAFVPTRQPAEVILFLSP